MVRVYLDACAVNRITDDPGQLRVREEAAAVLEIFRLISTGLVAWAASDILAVELLKNPNSVKLEEALGWLQKAGRRAPLTETMENRAARLVAVGYGYFDALHLACAEEIGVDSLITTDDRFLHKAERLIGNPTIRVLNPINWLQERRP